MAKSLGFALGKLGLGQSSIRTIRKNVSLVCLRSSYLIYLSRKNTTWRPWETKTHPLRRQDVAQNDKDYTILDDDGDFAGFSQLEIRKSASLNKRKCSLLGQQNMNYTNLDVARDFEGFSQLEIRKAANLNKRKCSLLRSEVKSFSGDSVAETRAAKIVNLRKTTGHRGAAYNMSANHPTKGRMVGLLNIGNTCYMNSIMQCLNSVTSLAEYFKNDEYCRDIDPRSKHGGIFAREVGGAVKLMNRGRGPVSLHELKAAAGKLHHPFKGSMQQDSHEFLLLMLNWLHEDLGGDVISLSPMGNIKTSKLDSLLQGTNQYSIICSACQYKSVSFEPFTVMSLSLPSSGRCTVEGLLKNAYQTSYVNYNCPHCNIHGECIRRSEIWKLPSVLILHLKRFDNSSRKKGNEIEFPLVKLKLSEYVVQGVSGVASFNLCSITNHYGTLTAGHYTSLCRSVDGSAWYKCDDQNVTKTRMSGVSGAAYILFYELSSPVPLD